MMMRMPAVSAVMTGGVKVMGLLSVDPVGQAGTSRSSPNGPCVERSLCKWHSLAAFSVELIVIGTAPKAAWHFCAPRPRNTAVLLQSINFRIRRCGGLDVGREVDAWQAATFV